jgi:hypothetical protein
MTRWWLSGRSHEARKNRIGNTDLSMNSVATIEAAPSALPDAVDFAAAISELEG